MFHSEYQIPVSLNNRLIVEKYVKGELRHKEKNGFALIDQKVNLKGLKVLVSAHVTTPGGSFTIHKGSTAYFKEEDLHAQPWAQKVLESEVVGVPFLIVDLIHVQLIVPQANYATPSETNV